MSKKNITTAMVLAAGLGTRMRPITNTIPKPLVLVDGRTLLDRALDSIVEAGINQAHVNVHYLADQIEEHLKRRKPPVIQISDEREELLDSGGGVNKAFAAEADKVVIILNSDSFWIDGEQSNIQQLDTTWNSDAMDMLLLLAEPHQSSGFDGAGDFFMNQDGQLTRRGNAEKAPYVYAGAIVTTISFLRTISDPKFSLNRLFDAAITEKRLYGCLLDGLWLHVGTPASIEEAEQAIEQHAKRQDSAP